MVKINKQLLLAFGWMICFAQSSFCQEKSTGIDQTKYKTALSFSTGLLTEKTRTTQLQGTLEFRPKLSRTALRADVFYFLNSVGDRPRFSMNNQLFVGAFYRFSDKALQPFVGFQPGIAYSQSSEFGSLNETTGELTYQKTINPVGSIAGGVDFFAEKLFFMFIETRYIFGKHKSDTYPVFLDEWRVSFGLGFHF